jgi:hypothetical protein
VTHLFNFLACSTSLLVQLPCLFNFLACSNSSACTNFDDVSNGQAVVNRGIINNKDTIWEWVVWVVQAQKGSLISTMGLFTHNTSFLSKCATCLCPGGDPGNSKEHQRLSRQTGVYA